MPKYPQLASRLNDLPNSVFEKFRPMFRKLGKKLIPFHIGDTYLQPPFSLPIEESFREKFKYFNRYSNTYGVAPLLEALVEKVRNDNGFSDISRNNIMITHGAINALNASIMAITNPGEEVIALTPCWPFFLGIVKMANCSVKQIPFYEKLYENDIPSVEEYLEKQISPKTVAIYVNTPNNPTGKVLSQEQMKAIAAVANKYNLWVISDEAYESFVYDGKTHLPFARATNSFERTITIYTFSKMFLVAGFRLGYIVASEKLIQQINKTLVHEIYSANSISQYMVVEAVKTRNQWLPEIQNLYEQHRNLVCNLLKAPHHVPEAGYYVFFSLRPYLKKSDFWELFEKILLAGVSLAPGEDFGEGFENYVRLCFTATPMEKLEKGIKIINKTLEEYYG